MAAWTKSFAAFFRAKRYATKEDELRARAASAASLDADTDDAWMNGDWRVPVGARASAGAPGPDNDYGYGTGLGF